MDGSTHWGLKPIPARVADRALTRFVVVGECHISKYSVGSHGYAQVGWKENGKCFTTTAQRAAWVAANDRQIPPGMTVDHTCHVRRCVRPLHLRLKTNPENASDNGQVHTNPLTGTACHLGHPMVLSLTTGRTYCRQCQAARKRARRQAMKGPWSTRQK